MVGYIVYLVGESCSLEQTISRIWGVNDLGQYGLNWLKNNFLGDILEDRQIILDTDRKSFKNEIQANYVSEKELEQYRYYHPYMFKRRLNDVIINLFDVRI